MSIERTVALVWLGCAVACNSADNGGFADETSGTSGGSSGAVRSSGGSESSGGAGSSAGFSSLAGSDGAGGSDSAGGSESRGGSESTGGSASTGGLDGSAGSIGSAGSDSTGGSTSAGPRCGNGKAEGQEQCDGADLNGATCASVSPEKPAGQLSCNSSCKFDASACQVASTFDACAVAATSFVLEVGKPGPRIPRNQPKDIDGNTVNICDLHRGRPMVVIRASVSCSPCTYLAKTFNEHYPTYREDLYSHSFYAREFAEKLNKGEVVAVFLETDGDPAKVKRYAEQFVDAAVPGDAPHPHVHFLAQPHGLNYDLPISAGIAYTPAGYTLDRGYLWHNVTLDFGSKSNAKRVSSIWDESFSALFP